ncbi:DnaA N-terminal domain-containing protein [Tsuneonella suprasediminis]|uniref:DnaA N-terminal domain-containing protein n=1 Tax=Tsuneonella suprasediminis TaxID=2306996 RepID=UPI002F922E53
MSWETQAWAAKQRPGSSSAKLVLLGLASCADANHCAFPSIQWLCDFSDLNRKTVIAALQRLEDGMFPLIEDTGERRGRTLQVKVYRLAAGAEGASADPASETVPKAEQSQKRNSSVFSRKQSQNRDTEPVSNLIPPSLPNGREAPTPKNRKSVSGKGTRLPADWTPPAVDDLPRATAALVRQWPGGAYAVVCDVFRCHFHSENGPQAIKRDWTATLAKWLTKDHSKIMRDAKAGISFAPSAARKPGSTPEAYRPVAARADEDERSQAIRAHLRRDLGAQLYEQWIEPVAVIWDEGRGGSGGVVVIAASEFQRAWIEDRFQPKIMAAARAVIGSGVRWTRFQVDQAQPVQSGKE